MMDKTCKNTFSNSNIDISGSSYTIHVIKTLDEAINYKTAATKAAAEGGVLPTLD